MSRMPAHILYYLRHALRVYVFVAAIAIFSAFSPVAYADPHAVFYTDRAQEQVFFNTLAALNQADFVEPGINDGTQNNRAQLVANRKNSTTSGPNNPLSGFQPESNSLITSTHTDLPGVVSRNITLEGNDLWTAYLVHQFAVEVASRRSASELARIYCERGLGRVGCVGNPGPAQQQETAFVTDSVKHIAQEGLAVAGILSSGDQSEQVFQDKLTGTSRFNMPLDPNAPPGASHPGPTEPDVPDSLKFPRPANQELAALRANNGGEKENLNLINQNTTALVAAQYNTGLNPKAFSDIKINGDGKVEVTKKDLNLKDYLNTVDDIGSFLPSLVTIAERGREQAEQFQYYRENPLALADYTLTKQNGGGVKATIDIPSIAKDAAVRDNASLISNLAINQKYASPDEINKFGTGNTSTAVPQVAGISTRNTDTPQTGQVAGISTSVYDLYQQYYNNPGSAQRATSPDKTLDNPINEPGIADALQAMVGNTVPDQGGALPQTCGFCTQLDSILQSSIHGAASLTETVYTELKCVFFPTTEACKLRTS